MAAWTACALRVILSGHAPLAQLDRALDSDSKGQRFESSRAHQSLEIPAIYFPYVNRPPWASSANAHRSSAPRPTLLSVGLKPPMCPD